jgi:hypothetical protein
MTVDKKERKEQIQQYTQRHGGSMTRNLFEFLIFLFIISFCHGGSLFLFTILFYKTTKFLP